MIGPHLGYRHAPSSCFRVQCARAVRTCALHWLEFFLKLLPKCWLFFSVSLARIPGIKGNGCFDFCTWIRKTSGEVLDAKWSRCLTAGGRAKSWTSTKTPSCNWTLNRISSQKKIFRIGRTRYAEWVFLAPANWFRCMEFFVLIEEGLFRDIPDFSFWFKPLVSYHLVCRLIDRLIAD